MNKFDVAFFDGCRWRYPVYIFHWQTWKWAFMTAQGVKIYQQCGCNPDFYSGVRVFPAPWEIGQML